MSQEGSAVYSLFSLIKLHLASHPMASSYSRVTVSSEKCCLNCFCSSTGPRLGRFMSRMHPYRKASTTSDFTIRAFWRSRLTCLRAVVQLPRVKPKANPPRTYQPVDLVRQVWGFSDDASQTGEGGRDCLAVLWPREVQNYLRCCRCTRNRYTRGFRLLLFEMVGLNAPKTSMETDTIHSNPRRRMTATRCTRR